MRIMRLNQANQKGYEPRGREEIAYKDAVDLKLIFQKFDLDEACDNNVNFKLGDPKVLSVCDQPRCKILNEILKTARTLRRFLRGSSPLANRTTNIPLLARIYEKNH